MKTRYSSLQFLATISTHNNSPLAKGVLAIQFFDLRENVWKIFANNVKVVKGKMNFKFSFTRATLLKEPHLKSAISMIEIGCFPNFRVVNFGEEQTLKVIAQGGNISIDKKRNIIINYGQNWLLDKKEKPHPNVKLLSLGTTDYPFYLCKNRSIKISTDLKKVYEENTQLKNQIKKIGITLKNLHSQIATKDNEIIALNTQINNLNNEIANLQTQLDSGSGNSDLAKKLAEKIKENNQLKQDKIYLETELEKLQIKFENFKRALDDVNKEIENKKIKIIELENEKKTLTQKLKECSTTSQKLDIEILKKKEEIAIKDETIKALKNEKDNITKEKKNLQNQLTQTNNKLSQCEKTNIAKDKTIEEKTTQLQKLEKDKSDLIEDVHECKVQTENFTKIIIDTRKEIAEKEDQINDLEKETGDLKTKIEELQQNQTEHPNKLEARNVYKSIIEEVQQTDVMTKNSPYKLAGVKLNLKATIEKGPNGVLFGLIPFEKADQVCEAAISNIEMEVISNDVPKPRSGIMPNLKGLTETAVRKVLHKYGLRLKPVYHPTADGKLVIGQSFKQTPSAGSDVTPEQVVTVVFAKPLKKEK